jgi:aromatic ring hydroxylase
MNHYFTMHHSPTEFISDWHMYTYGEKRGVYIDGALIDPQFMRSSPVALVSELACQISIIERLILGASLETPTLQNFTKQP